MMHGQNNIVCTMMHGQRNIKLWKPHIAQTIPKLSAAGHTIQSTVHISNTNTVTPIFCTHCNSVIRYGNIHWGNFSNSDMTFTLQKKIVRIMTNAQPRTSCRSIFKQLEIIPVPWQCTLPWMSCIINNQENFQIHLYTI
jgi:hypothetical protein